MLVLARLVFLLLFVFVCFCCWFLIVNLFVGGPLKLRDEWKLKEHFCIDPMFVETDLICCHGLWFPSRLWSNPLPCGNTNMA